MDHDAKGSNVTIVLVGAAVSYVALNIVRKLFIFRLVDRRYREMRKAVELAIWAWFLLSWSMLYLFFALAEYAETDKQRSSRVSHIIQEMLGLVLFGVFFAGLGALARSPRFVSSGWSAHALWLLILHTPLGFGQTFAPQMITYFGIGFNLMTSVCLKRYLKEG